MSSNPNPQSPKTLNPERDWLPCARGGPAGVPAGCDGVGVLHCARLRAHLVRPTAGEGNFVTTSAASVMSLLCGEIFLRNPKP